MGDEKSDDRAGEMARMLARAEAAVADLAKSYTGWAAADVDKCTALLTAARSVAGEERVALARDVHAVAHNIKGQGTSFGYPLMTRIGQSLCLLTRRKTSFVDSDLDLAGAHLDAMRLVLAKEIRGDGGDIGAKLGSRLEEKVRAALEGD